MISFNYLVPSLPRGRGLSPLSLCVKILKALILFSILAICSAHPNLLDLISLNILGKL